MNILSLCKTSNKKNREYIYEIESGQMKIDKTNSKRKIIPLIFEDKNKGNNLLSNYSQTEQFQNSSFIKINKSCNNNYYNKSIWNSNFSDYTPDKDFVFQIKKVAPVELPTDSELDNDNITNGQQKNYDLVKIGKINKRYDNEENDKINKEQKDSYLNIMNLKNMLSESFKEIEVYINSGFLKEDLNNIKSNNNINNEFKIKSQRKKKIAIRHKTTYANNNKNSIQKKLNIKIDYNKRNTSLENNKKSLQVLFINHKQKLSFKKNKRMSKNLLKNKNSKNSSKLKDRKNLDHSNGKNNIQKKELDINKVLNLNKHNVRKNVKTISLTEHSKKCLRRSISSNDNILRYNNYLNKIKEVTRSPNLKVQGRNKYSKWKIQIGLNISNLYSINHQKNRQSFIDKPISKNNNKNIKYIHRYFNIKNIVKSDEQQKVKNKKKNRKTKNRIFSDNPFTVDNKLKNFTQKNRSNEHSSGITINAKVNKFIK